MYKLLYTIIFSALLAFSAYSQGIKFQNGELKKLLVSAGKKKKLLFVDTHASWCGPCKMMDRDIFPKDEIGNYYNREFVCLKIDVESPEGKEFDNKYKVASIPTFFFLDENGEVIYKKTGGTDNPEVFIEYGQTAQDIFEYKTQKKEISTPRSLIHYAYFLKEQKDSSCNTYLHRFLAKQEDWSSKENLQIILDLAEVENSPALEYFAKNIDSIALIMGEETVAEKRLLVILDRSIEFLKNVPLGQKPDMSKLEPIFIKYFGKTYKQHFLLFQFRYYQQQEDYTNIRTVLRRFIEEVVIPMPDGREKAVEYINTATVFYEAAKGDEQLEEEALAWGEKALELDQSADIYTIMAVLCQDAGYIEKADLYQQKANEAKKKE